MDKVKKLLLTIIVGLIITLPTLTSTASACGEVASTGARVPEPSSAVLIFIAGGTLYILDLIRKKGK